jgi:hypothetical protein
MADAHSICRAEQIKLSSSSLGKSQTIFLLIYVHRSYHMQIGIVCLLTNLSPHKSFLPNRCYLQILNWLSHYPSDLESYIRPGCVILTIYLRLPNWMWDKVVLCSKNSDLDTHTSLWLVVNNCIPMQLGKSTL